MRSRLNNTMVQTAVAVSVCLAVGAGIVWLVSSMYTQCLDDGYTPTSCRMMLTGHTLFAR